MHLVLKTAPTVTRLDALCLLSNLIENSTEDSIDIFNNRGIIHLILELCQSRDFALKNEAFWCFSNMVHNFSTNNCK